VLFPVVIGECYGSQDFGKYFAYLEISSSLASIATPQIATAIMHRFSHYYYLTFGMGALLFSSAVVMLYPKNASSAGPSSVINNEE
jgi:hypothetical protein